MFFRLLMMLDIDHFIPLVEVHRSGGNVWAALRRKNYANDLSNPNILVAVYLGPIGQKGIKIQQGDFPQIRHTDASICERGSR